MQKIHGFIANFIERLKRYAVDQDRMEIPALWFCRRGCARDRRFARAAYGLTPVSTGLFEKLLNIAFALICLYLAGSARAPIDKFLPFLYN